MKFEDLLPCAKQFINFPQSKEGVSSPLFSFSDI